MAAAAVVLEVGGAVIDGFLQLAACSLDGCARRGRGPTVDA